MSAIRHECLVAPASLVAALALCATGCTAHDGRHGATSPVVSKATVRHEADRTGSRVKVAVRWRMAHSWVRAGTMPPAGRFSWGPATLVAIAVSSLSRQTARAHGLSCRRSLYQTLIVVTLLQSGVYSGNPASAMCCSTESTATPGACARQTPSSQVECCEFGLRSQCAINNEVNCLLN
jgi:hypothetical protein